MNRKAPQELFQLALVLRAAYRHRSAYDRRSALTVERAMAYGEQLLRTAGMAAPTVTTSPA